MAEVYVVHCVDTEGPLYESLPATFMRIKDLTGMEFKPSNETLRKIQNGEIALNGYEEIAQQVFSKRLLDYNYDWHKLDEMLDKATERSTRMKYQDSFGKPWRFSWFIMDHADYDTNPRRRDIGYNNIWQHYKDYYLVNGIDIDDDFEWHAHPASVYKEANHCDTSYINSQHILQSLAHRVIDCHAFPICYRPGVHTERPDSHWLLEQFIPYDYANQAIAINDLEKRQEDTSGGRFGDWRRATTEWKPYHPAHDDYQVEGNCNRVIFRILNVGTRLRLLTQAEVDKAFARASLGVDTIMAFADHDFRNFLPDMDEVFQMLQDAQSRYPGIKWHNSTAREAARHITNSSGDKIRLKTHVERTDNCMKLNVETNIDTFGPQPFLAVRTKGNRYIVENFDFQVPKRKWTYTFDAETIHADDVKNIGIATNSMQGTGCLCILDENGQKLVEKDW